MHETIFPDSEPELLTEDEAFEVTWRFIKYTARGGFFSYDQVTAHLEQLGAVLPEETEDRETLLYQWFDEIQAIEQEQGEPVRLIDFEQDGEVGFALARVVRTSPTPPTIPKAAPQPVLEPEQAKAVPIIEPTPESSNKAEPIIAFEESEVTIALSVLAAFVRDEQLQARKTPQKLVTEIADSTNEPAPTLPDVRSVCRKLVTLNLLAQPPMTRGKHTLRFSIGSRIIKNMLRTPEGREYIQLHIELGEPFEDASN